MLILLKDTKRNLLWLWLGFSIPVLLLVLIQTISGKFEGIEGTAWTWVAINLFPVLGLLLFGAIQNKYPGKPIQIFIFRIIWITSFLFLLLLLMTLLGMTAGTANQSIESYLNQSYKWLLPFQILLIGIFFLLYFKKRSIFQVNEKILKNHIQSKANKAKQQANLPQQQAFDQLQAGNYTQLFDHLQNHFNDTSSDEHTATVVFQSRYNKWKNDTDLDVVDKAEAQRSLNELVVSLADFISKM